MCSPGVGSQTGRHRLISGRVYLSSHYTVGRQVHPARRMRLDQKIRGVGDMSFPNVSERKGKQSFSQRR